MDLLCCYLWMDVIANYGKLNYHDQDYAWVQRGMIFPFMDFVDRCVVIVIVIV